MPASRIGFLINKEIYLKNSNYLVAGGHCNLVNITQVSFAAVKDVRVPERNGRSTMRLNIILKFVT